MTGLVCALTGHRDLPANFDINRLFDELETLIEEGYTTFRCGMARGFDLAALECLVRLKEKYALRILACIPHTGQENRYPAREKARYRELLQWCDEQTVLYDSCVPGCYLARNRYMVDKADLVFAYCTRETGGAAYTVGYAKKQGVEVRRITGSSCPTRSGARAVGEVGT